MRKQQQLQMNSTAAYRVKGGIVDSGSWMKGSNDTSLVTGLVVAAGPANYLPPPLLLALVFDYHFIPSFFRSFITLSIRARESRTVQ